ncbi:DUF397 domain-containing protein [Streptomyces rimosus]|uniref:DUF397 domain-containing protein n=1 Tax=Streptomyces rimosus TaxID=1927 RepID=UPI00051838E4|nr:DUF397 domain-containing protein [Streptomyces rimosus]
MTTDPRTLIWSKSSYSGNGGTCVEWAPAQATTGTVPVRDSKNPNGPVLSVATHSFAEFISAWSKSSYSGNGGSCVEWAPAQATTGTVPVRDSKNPNGPVLSVATHSFAEFI